MEETATKNEIKKDYIHIPGDPILIVEDILENQILLKSLCKNLGLECEVAENGQEALDLASKKNYSLYIVDLMLPVMDGRKFTKELKNIKTDPIVLIQSALDTNDVIINVMKLGVFDYIIKPIEPEVFNKTIKKALEFKYHRDNQKNLTDQASLKLRSQLEWLNYKESRRKTSTDSSELLSIENLKTSLSQGAGVGSMVTLFDLISTNKKKDESGKYYLIDAGIFDMIEQNNIVVRNMLDGLMSISDILQKEFQLVEISGKEVVGGIADMLQNVMPYLIKKNIKVTLPSLMQDCRVFANMERLGSAIEELAINALKYTPETGGILDIFSYVAEGYLCITFKNDINENPYGGIPSEYERLVKEPFFRLLTPLVGVNEIEKFSLGLGLTVVDHIAAKHHGMFFIHDVKDHTGSSVKNCVLAEIFIPLAKEKE
ncbi:MAG: response regulator [Spirochaetia bacterium]|nr:response regulator [Spirochaetia bacterium]